jgi:hypothetical protein
MPAGEMEIPGGDMAIPAKVPVYQGTQVKLDIASPILVPAANKWQIQHYEVAVNVRLKDRFYPTFEVGYSGGTAQRDSITYTPDELCVTGETQTVRLGGNYSGQGGFFRVGCDINPLKKHPESPHALLVGVRFGTAVQGIKQCYNQTAPYCQAVKADCWGEVVAGCQVEIAKVNNTAFYMGWMGRFRCLFTRKTADDRNNPYPIYIPGFGKRDNIAWGANYYLGWRF